MEQKIDKFPWLYLLLLSSVTFMGILSELVPSGILPQMSEGLQVSYSSIGLLVSVYAIASAIGTIPLITLTMPMNRKKLLTILMVVFGVSNLIIAVSSLIILLLLQDLSVESVQVYCGQWFLLMQCVWYLLNIMEEPLLSPWLDRHSELGSDSRL